MNNSLKFTCIETFCGAGGLGYGLKKAGFELLWAFDIDPMAIETYTKNVSTKASVADATKLTAEELINLAGIKKRELTLLSGGPPCQGFSRQNKNGEKGDKRNRLVVKYIRLVQNIEPMFFLMENVDTFQKKRGKVYLDLLQKSLSNLYDMHKYEINCADYGVPQIRKRSIIIGVRKDIGIEYTLPRPTHKQENWVTVGQALKLLPEPPPDGSEHTDIPNHCISKISEENKERISYVPQGSGRKCIPRRLQLPCHKKSNGWPDVFGRIAVDRPAPTITGGFDSFTRGKYAHPYEDRPITPKEAAILQSFDRMFRFYGNKGDIRRQIGNAVPPLIGEVLGKSIINSIRLNLLKGENNTLLGEGEKVG
ncbi:MAG TPA: DNA cytosine methyltransferase [Patescibacteria group bacterium]|nr:DNA cytosine methyltransferase [Patescibacteria group bacterium]